MDKRVVITGCGIVSPIGNDLASNWESLTAGKSGIGNISRFDTKDWPVKISGEVKGFDEERYVDKKQARRLDRFLVFAIAAGTMAMEDSGLSSYQYDPCRAGTYIGSGIGGFETICDTNADYLTGGLRKVSPFFIPAAIINMASGIVSIHHNLKGPNLSAVSACSTGTHCIGEAAKIIMRGDADIMLAGGAESPITPVAVAGFLNMKALSRRNDKPAQASRPFDKERDGFVIAEGAAIVVLESHEHAVKRGAAILAEFAGYGLTGDAYHITAPDSNGDGARRCMAMAVNNAGIAPEQINYINAHGTSTPMNDSVETKAIKDLFGDYAYKVHISSTKSMTGHMLGAAGAAEVIYCILSMNNSLIPPTINLENPDPDCDLNYTPISPIKADINYALSNSFGFGGTNAAIVIKKYVR